MAEEVKVSQEVIERLITRIEALEKKLEEKEEKDKKKKKSKKSRQINDPKGDRFRKRCHQ